MTKLIGLFLCRVWFRKHKRGKRINPDAPGVNTAIYLCRRCGAQWRRGVKPKPAEPAIPASIRRTFLRF